MKTVVCGAGINGIATALWLRRAGVDVTLIDQKGPAAGTSFGNAGVLSSGSVIPITVPGIARKAPAMLVDPKSPLFIRWGYLPKLLPFLRRYLKYATLDHVRYYANSMHNLIGDSLIQHIDLAKGTGAEKFISDHDYCYAYSTQNAFNSDSWAWELRKSLGLEFDVIGGDEFSESDPLYHGKFCKVVRNKNHGRISDPGAYLKALFAEFVSLGGQFEQAKVISLRQSNSSLSAVQFSNGEMTADNFVFTLGPWSGDIARSLGLNVPFESEGGYHIELINPSEMPLETVKVASGKFVVTPMQSRIRLAGIVDFSGLSGPDNSTAIELLKISAKELFPSIRYERMETWHGHRPTTANSLPLIGKLQTFPNAFVGFGHQHVGLTGGAKTGRILANLVTGEEPCIDLSAFDPNTYNCSQI